MVNRSVVLVLFVSLLLVTGLMVLHSLLCVRPGESVSKVEVMCRFSPESNRPQSVVPVTNYHHMVLRESVVVTNWVYGTKAKEM